MQQIAWIDFSVLLYAEPGFPERDVVVTGIGLVTPLAVERAATWARLLAGKRSTRELGEKDIDHFHALSELSGIRCFGAPADHMAVRRRLLSWGRLHDILADSAMEAWVSEPVTAMTLAAAEEAVADAGYRMPLPAQLRSGCFVGASKGGLRTAEQLVAGCRSVADGECDSDGSRWWNAFQVDAGARALSAVAGINTRISSPVAACASGLISILQGAMAIASGECDVCIAGSADAALRASVLASFNRLRVTSRHSVADTACRPFDASRDGFVVGEGAAMLLLESRQQAMSRGARIYARITAGGWLNDPTGITQIDVSGSVISELLNRTLKTLERGQRQRTEIDYLNLHGTATVSNDAAEAKAVRQVFGEKIPWCSGVKGSIGHLLGAAGSVESALTILAIHHQQLPGMVNSDTQEQGMNLPLVTGTSMVLPVRRAIKLSLGFGGHVACGVFDAEARSD